MSETVFHANFDDQNNRFAADFRSVQIAGDGGTEVTLGGEVQGTFAADTYVAARLAELVSQSPETLDTLAELAKALGNDPNFATTVMELIGQKLDVSTLFNKVYGTGNNGEQKLFAVSGNADGNTIAYRGAGGRLNVGVAVNGTNAVPLTQMNEALENKLDQATGKYTLYGVGGDGAQRMYSLSYAPKGADAVPLSGTGGELRGGRAVNQDGLVPLAQMNEALGGKLDKMTRSSGNFYVYGLESDGQTPTCYALQYAPKAPNRVPLTTTGGQVQVGDAVLEGAAVNLKQLNTILDERIGDISAALDEVHAYAQALVNGGAAV